MNAPGGAAAARNNAAWCDIVCSTYGNPGEFGALAWTTPRRSPPYYPDAVTLDPAVESGELMRRIDTGAGCSVKDSFANIDLEPYGFRVLFEAEWIGRAARPAEPPRDAARWQLVRTVEELADWEVAWAAPDPSTSLFRPQLLDRPDVAVCAGRDGRRVVAGAVLNRAVGAVGLSNLFADDADVGAAWDAAVASPNDVFPGAPIVGYESGDALAAALRHGFVSLGELRVWINE